MTRSYMISSPCGPLALAARGSTALGALSEFGSTIGARLGSISTRRGNDRGNARPYSHFGALPLPRLAPGREFAPAASPMVGRAYSRRRDLANAAIAASRVGS